MSKPLATIAVKDYNADTANGVTILSSHKYSIEQIKTNKDLQGGFDIDNMELVEIALTEDGTAFKFVVKEEK